ncbi:MULTISPECIES: hypothetical protein [Actinokineospora]|uniref:Uncharacterized protein n=1 Tax=Actinokineospora fastidiosa TaxID=1816 RepID=A0A918LA67_9PSEU|nr:MULTISPECIES: hypothetical protein [Actinokineospora]UVS81935.1 hypothetical protein Actkin_05699 [Actinokineospora sp. UTMC 2448]GGS24716.1 hypothetical protein GCM10010171_17390 [Actinokineospora fastidiosa]
MSESDIGGYRGEADAFHAYTAGMRPLADDLRGVADGLDVADGAFSKIGDEVGLTAALRAAGERQATGVRGLADSYGGIVEAVANTWTNFEAVEDDEARNLRRAAGEP